MPSGRIHELISIFALVLLIATLQFCKVPYNFPFLAGAWIFGTFYLSPDLDARYSRSKNRIGYFRYAFIFFRHRGILHNPFFWIFIFLICLKLKQGWIGAGLSGQALVHIILDKII